MTPLHVRLIATAVVVVVAIGLSLYGRKLEQSDAVFENVLITVLLLVTVWVPRTYRDYGIIACVGLIGMAGGIVTAAVSALATWGITAMIPGGGTALILGVLALLAYFIGREERQRLRKVEDAKRLVPGESRSVECAVVGPVRATRKITRPDNDEPCAAWWVTVKRHDDEDDDSLYSNRQSDADFEVDTGDGIARVYPDNADLTNSGLSFRGLDDGGDEDDHAAFDRTAARLGLDATRIESFHIASIPDGKSVFVLGTPTWQADPQAGGGYRESSFVPVFRGDDKRELVLKVGTLAEIKRRITFSSAMWGVWSLPCIGVAVLQFGFGY